MFSFYAGIVKNDCLYRHWIKDIYKKLYLRKSMGRISSSISNVNYGYFKPPIKLGMGK